MPSPAYFPVQPNRLLYVAAAADQLVTGTTAQVATALTLTLEAGRVYLVNAGVIFGNSSAVPTAGLSFTGPSAATMKWNSTTGSTNYRPTIGSVDAYTGSAATRLALISGRLVTDAAAGGALTLTLSTSDGAQTSTLYADSWLTATRVA
jgi:hypothetical protein